MSSSKKASHWRIYKMRRIGIQPFKVLCRTPCRLCTAPGRCWTFWQTGTQLKRQLWE